jgi:glycosyltransferase involved in cell wall biosynthesis
VLAHALRALLDDSTRAKELAEAGQSRADEFSMDRLAGRFVDVYERAIAADRVA